MTTTITPATIARLRELLNKAAPREWAGIMAFIVEAERGTHRTICSFVNCDGDGGANQRLVIAAVNALPALLDQLDAQAAEIERLRAELAVERQCRNGHLPDCAGIDFEQMRCGCGYLDGTAYRSLADEIERLKAECIREHARAFAPFCEQSERADKAEARVVELEDILARICDAWCDEDCEFDVAGPRSIRDGRAALAKREGGR